MSGYPSYPYNTSQTGYGAIPQYTQSQVDSYFGQYGCYPPQPYNVIPDSYYGQPAAHHYQQQASASPYTHGQYPLSGSYGAASDPHRLVPRSDEDGLRRSRSTSRQREGKTWTCDLSNCTSTANFTRLADLQRHQSTVHGIGTPDFPCTVAKCTRVGDKGFTRRDHLVEHLRNFHHLDIPKRRPGERSANPLGLPHYGTESRIRKPSRRKRKKVG